MKALILLSALAVAFANQECGQNEHFENCGTACPLTCNNYFERPKPCPLICSVGCHCDEGFVRNEQNGLCVKATECPTPKCGQNEHFENCGTACPLTCDNYFEGPKPCFLICSVGCHCDDGFVRNEQNGLCVKATDCPTPKCMEDAHFDTCGSPCPLTCDNHNDPPIACERRCDIGCHCDEGFVKTSDGQHCIRPFQCPINSTCGENQRYNGCGSACPLTCDNMNNPPEICPAMCKIGCECQEGYVETSDGRCVKPENCPTKTEQVETNCVDEHSVGLCFARLVRYYYDPETNSCEEFIYGGCGGNGNRYLTRSDCIKSCAVWDANEHFTDCGTACPKTCDNYDDPPEPCVKMCISGFQCNEGFVRSSDGRCVRTEDCPKEVPVCGENQRYTECGSACSLTCENRKDPPKFCPAVCIAGCQCVRGYLKTSDGRCVKPEDCPSEAENVDKTCYEEAESGMCHGYFPSFYYDPVSKTCKTFVYGGCGGNGNRYEKEEDCLKNCGAQAAVAHAPIACHQEKVVGTCDREFERWYYNPDQNECQDFVYSGCGGNSNNFNTKGDCESLCKS